MSLELYYRIDINIIAFIVLFIFTYFAFKRFDLSERLNQLYMLISVSILFQLVFETITAYINRIDIPVLALLNFTLHMLLFIIGPIVAFMWFYFLIDLVKKRSDFSKWFHRGALLLLSVAILLALMTPVTGWLFYVTDSNIYVRGPLFVIPMVINYFFILAGTALLCIYNKNVTRQDRVLVYLLGIIPVLGGFFQVLIYGVLLIWSSVAFTLVIAYIFLSERTTRIDYLTQAITRESFMHYMSRQMLRKSERIVGLVYLDMDGLKSINDQYGHTEGDHALKTIVNLIKQHIHQNELIVRMGGDEFLIVMDVSSKAEITARISTIKNAVKDYNDKSLKPYLVSFSHGEVLFDKSHDELEKVIKAIDFEMYRHKQEK